jgi:hypothetical protein
MAVTEPDSIAVQFLDRLSQRDFHPAFESMSEQMKAALPESKLEEVWRTLQLQAGAYQHRDQIHSESSGAYRVVVIGATFEKSPLNVKISIDGQGRVAGLFFLPVAQPAAAVPTPTGLVEREVKVGAAGWPLAGTLTLPAGAQHAPLVILVHGSGPHDRNETIGPNTPFRDLAHGLAERGVAVLRYDKRTFVYPERMASEGVRTMTVEDEVVADALAAADSGRHWPGIDARRIYILGHSLGGYLVPRILARDGRLAGGIILAGSTRHLEDILLEQLDYLASQQGGGDKGDAAQREMLRNQALKIKALTDKDRDTPGFFIGAPASYWLDLRVYDPVKTASAQSLPLLILQGNRDYQVTAADFAGWQRLSGRGNVELHQYPELNHLFIAGTGPSTPAEYQQEGHVDSRVIADIAGWLTGPAARHP